MIATTTVSPVSSSDHGLSLTSPSLAEVLRVSREIENIGERVPMSKKRITWRFVFADSEQVHTVMLEHSRMTAKKRLRLDGRRLFTSEQYCPGDWRYEFMVSKTHAAKFSVAIKDVKSTVVEERSLDSIYQLVVDGHTWDQLEERKLLTTAVRGRNNSGAVWSSELYARRVIKEERVLERIANESNNNSSSVTAQCVAWTFAFGFHGTVHKLELRDLDRGDDGGEFVVILDSRLVERVNHDDIKGDVWEYEHTLLEKHTLSVAVTLESEGKKYDLFIDGCAWKDLGETDFVLQSGWFPVYSRSRGTSYFRNETSGVTQWERPIMSRNGVAIDLPRRLSAQSLPPPPTDIFDSDGLIRVSTGHDNQVPELMPVPAPMANSYGSQQQTQAAATKSENSNKSEANLLDFSEMAVHVSPTAQLTSSLDSFDPFAHLAAQQPPQQQQLKPQTDRRSSNTSSSTSYQPPVDLLS